ncbi:MAG TPA: helix-turn-helix domain-containing protein [Tepidisphaeraceae bacterium]|nr:helix-turn-helix domain-containing protein [Tepidisphaeraceae bacterium]
MSRTLPTTLNEPDSYMGLVSRLRLRPIRTKADYAAAAKLVDELAVRGERDLDEGERDYLEVLSKLIAAYDDEHYPVAPDSRPANEKLKSLLLEQGMTAADLSEVLGISRSLAGLILNGKRGVTGDYARKLGARFKVDAGYFL